MCLTTINPCAMTIMFKRLPRTEVIQSSHPSGAWEQMAIRLSDGGLHSFRPQRAETGARNESVIDEEF